MQAEADIRDYWLSRGVGGIYKRQIQEAILDTRMRELADMYLRQHVETLTMACELFGCKEPKLDAELIFATFLTIEQRLLVHPEKISQEFVEKRMYNMLDKVVPLHG